MKEEPYCSKFSSRPRLLVGKLFNMNVHSLSISFSAVFLLFKSHPAEAKTRTERAQTRFKSFFKGLLRVCLSRDVKRAACALSNNSCAQAQTAGINQFLQEMRVILPHQTASDFSRDAAFWRLSPLLMSYFSGSEGSEALTFTDAPSLTCPAAPSGLDGNPNHVRKKEADGNRAV